MVNSKGAVKDSIDGDDLGASSVDLDLWLDIWVDGSNLCRDGDVGIVCRHEGEISVAYCAITEVGGNSDCVADQLIIDDFNDIVSWYTGDPCEDRVWHTVN